jgi:lysophospholipase L1-like esterase
MKPAPRLVLIGDSIRLGYQSYVGAALDGIAEVWGPRENCSSTRHILARADSWLISPVSHGDVVHLNAGLHDLRRLPETDGAPLVPLDEYERNLDEIVAVVIEAAGVDRVCLATSTPVDDARHSAGRVSDRHEADVLAYNTGVISVAARHGVLLNDLHTAIAAASSSLLGEDGVHLSAAGNLAASRAVVAATKRLLG